MKNNFSISLAAICLTLLTLGCNTTPPPNMPPPPSMPPTADMPPPPNMPPPDEIKVPAGATLFCTAHVDGTKHAAVQTYRCDSIAPGQYGWVPAGPKADLYNDKDELIGKHFGIPTAPTWELKKDGSKVIGKKIHEAPGMSGAVPLLLLEGVGHEGTGDFNQVKWIQRLATEGGLKPTEACDKYTLGKIMRVPYKATYYFYK